MKEGMKTGTAKDVDEYLASVPAKEIFLVEIVDDHGDDIDVLADASDVYAGTESGWLNAGTYYLDVAADSPWTVTMSTS
jgi:hypothetical protein